MTYKLLHGDCLVLLKEIPDNSIDLILTDPPYIISRKVALLIAMKTLPKNVSLNLVIIK